MLAISQAEAGSRCKWPSPSPQLNQALNVYSVSIALIAGLVVYLLQNTWNLYNACTNATLSNEGHQVTFPPQYGQSAADSKVSRLHEFIRQRLPRLLGTKVPGHTHKGSTGRVRTGNQLYPALCHCQLGQDIIYKMVM